MNPNASVPTTDIMPFTLETERLLIRSYQEDDLAAAHAVTVSAFGSRPLEQTTHWLTWQISNYKALANLGQPPYGDRAVVLKATGEIIGSVGLVQCYGPFETLPSFRARLSNEPSRFNTAEMGLFWALHETHRKQGYATEAAEALVNHAFTQMGLSRIVATTEDANEASMAVMRRLGMTIERNPYPEPAWFEVVGVLFNPAV